jgi:hypothetical protein
LNLDIYVPPVQPSAQYSKAVQDAAKEEAVRGLTPPRTEPPGYGGPSPAPPGSPGA